MASFSLESRKFSKYFKNNPKLPSKSAVKKRTSTPNTHRRGPHGSNNMQLPSIDRNPNVRPAGADLASAGANRVIPVAPVNPSVSASPPLESPPSVINKVNATPKPSEGEPVYTSVSDPATRGSEAATSNKDWTIHRPVQEKVEDPPPKPISQVLIDHLRTMWTAGASAIQVEQVKNQLTPPSPLSPSDAPGDLAKQVLVYTANQVKKTENI